MTPPPVRAVELNFDRRAGDYGASFSHTVRFYGVRRGRCEVEYTENVLVRFLCEIDGFVECKLVTRRL